MIALSATSDKAIRAQIAESVSLSWSSLNDGPISSMYVNEPT